MNYEYTNMFGQQVPYYRYFDQDEFAYYTGLVLSSDGQNYPGNGDYRLHEIPAWNIDYYNTNPSTNEMAGLRMLRLTNGMSTYRDINGAIIEGEYVYAIQKARGNWRPGIPGHNTTITESGADWCDFGADLNTMMTVINNHEDTNPYTPLVCEPNLGSYSNESGYDGCTFDEIYNTDNSEFEELEVVEESSFAIVYLGNESFHPFLEFSYDCRREPEPFPGPGGGSAGGGNNLSYLANLELLSVTRFNNGGENILSTSASELFYADGTPNVPTLDLQKGLYRIVVKYPNRPLDYIFVEVVKPGTVSAVHKDFFAANIYPNPTANHEYYSIDMNTSARLKMTYETFDNQGNPISRFEYDLEKDHSSTHKFSSEILNPNGMTFHKFTFYDGSFETITTIQ